MAGTILYPGLTTYWQASTPSAEMETLMFAIVEASGRQYQLEAGRFVDLDLQELNDGDEFVFDRVLMLVNGKDSTLGAPLVEGAKVIGKVLSNGRSRKIIVYHQKPKKGTRKKQGHRQGFTRVHIDSILLNDKVLAKAEPRPEKAEAAPKANQRTSQDSQKTCSGSESNQTKRNKNNEEAGKQTEEVASFPIE
jgi:large subunit ribosomal protein L21